MVIEIKINLIVLKSIEGIFFINCNKNETIEIIIIGLETSENRPKRPIKHKIFENFLSIIFCQYSHGFFKMRWTWKTWLNDVLS